MIYLKPLNVLFLKARKVAGTSFEIGLSQFADPGGIITPISHDDEKTRKKPGYAGPQNYRKPFSEYDGARLSRWSLPIRKPKMFPLQNTAPGI